MLLLVTKQMISLIIFLFIELIHVPTSGCNASSEENQGHSCSKALDGNMKTDFATKGQGVGAWIKVREFRLEHIMFMPSNP